MPNVCLLSTFSGKERERQRVGNDHRPSLAACCGWKKKILSGSKEKKNCVRCNGISGDDAYQENRYKPKLRVADPASMSVLDFWEVFRFLLARALVKSFRKQTQGSNLARNALQRESCTRQLGF